MPAGEPITVAPTPDFYRWSFASMWTPGPFESKPTRAYYYLTDVDPSWPRRAPGRASARLQLPDALVDLDPRGLPGPLPPVPAPAARRIEGAQVDHVRAGVVRRRMGALLRADDDGGGLRPAGYSVKLGQLAEALIRLARFIVCIRLHAEDMSVEQGVRFFRDEAFMEESERAARSRARHLRSDVSGLQRRQADAAEAAPGLQAAAGQGVFAAHLSRHAARPTAPRRSGSIVS